MASGGATRGVGGGRGFAVAFPPTPNQRSGGRGEGVVAKRNRQGQPVQNECPDDHEQSLANLVRCSATTQQLLEHVRILKP